MKRFLRRHHKLIVVITVSVALASYLFWWLSTTINQSLTIENIKAFVESTGLAAPLIFILFCASTNVFSPLVITPFWVAGILIFPFPWSFIYIYGANLLGHSLNFLIAKIWGRQLVVKFTGKKGLQKIDKFTDIAGWKMVFLVRLMGGAVTDYISYALGFTNLKFLPYFFITLVAFAPWMIFTFWLIQQGLATGTALTLRNLGIMSLGSYLLTTLTAYLIYLNKRKMTKIASAIDPESAPKV